jgi:hypothetical protein
MVLKKFYITTICLCALNISFSQDWMDVGTKWYYTQSPWGTIGPPLFRFEILEVISKDTVDGKSMYKIEGYPGCSGVGYVNYLYPDSNKVYHYIQSLNEYVLLYDFDKEAGEGWEMKRIGLNYRDSFYVRVDSISSIQINGQEKKVQHISLISLDEIDDFVYYDWGLEIIEDIGNSLFMFPQYGACDPILGPLRCKMMGNEIYSFVDYPCDAIISNLNEVNEMDLKLYPTIVRDMLYITTNEWQGKEIQIRIYDTNGRLIKTEKRLLESIISIDFSGVQNGLKIIEIITSDKKGMFKMIKM